MHEGRLNPKMEALAQKVSESNGDLYIFSDQPKDGFRFALMKGNRIDRTSIPRDVEGVAIDRDAKTSICIGRKSTQKPQQNKLLRLTN